MGEETTGTRSPVSRWMGRHGDLLLVLAWLLAVIALASTRVLFMGDGIRHVVPIFESPSPSLGEPRWLLFPAMLFAVLRPLSHWGWIQSVEAVIRAFVWLDVIAGLVYMLALRLWLKHAGASTTRRAAALLLAGMAAPMLRLSSDAAEPLLAATVAVAGLAFLASRPKAEQERAVPVAVAVIGFATLLYQGVLFALALVPCAVPVDVWRRGPVLVRSFAVLAIVPLVMISALVAQGDTPSHAMDRLVSGEENTLYVQAMRAGSLPIWPFAAAVTVGPASAIVPIRENRGLRGSLALLSSKSTAAVGLLGLAGLALSLVVLSAGLRAALRHGDWFLIAGFAGILVLPLLRSFQYSYVKFYVLMPVVLALGAIRASSTARLAIAGALVMLCNYSAEIVEISRTRRLVRAVQPVFAQAGERACWLTAGWGPPLPGWPGQVTSMMQLLHGGHGTDVAAISARNNEALSVSVHQCFCNSTAVLTGDMTEKNTDQVTALMRQFRVTSPDLASLLWGADKGSVVFDREGVRVLAYAADDRSSICRRLDRQLRL